MTITRVIAPRMYLFAESHDSVDVTPELKNGSALAGVSLASTMADEESSLKFRGSAGGAKVPIRVPVSTGVGLAAGSTNDLSMGSATTGFAGALAGIAADKLREAAFDAFACGPA